MNSKLRDILRIPVIQLNNIIIFLFVILIALLLFWASQAANKTIWDYLEKLIIPIVIGAVAFWYEREAKKREENIACDNQSQATLSTYFDRMSDLLLDSNLRDSKENEEVCIIARARTISVLRNLDGKRIAQVLQFLTESDLGGTKLLESIELVKADLHRVDLREADLRNADLRKANLSKTHLWGASLQEADLSCSNLQDAYLMETNMQDAMLCKANMSRASLEKAVLHGADLSQACVQGAHLAQCNLVNACLYRADLQGTYLELANLQGADLRETNLRGTDLTEANFDKALVTCGQLAKVKTLIKATLPNGMQYEGWVTAGKPDWTKEAWWLERKGKTGCN